MQSRYHDLIFARAPRHYYRLNDGGSASALDIGTTGANGTYQGGTQRGVPSLLTADPSDRSAYFNGGGTSDFIQFATDASWQGGVVFSTIAWVEPASLASYRTIMGCLGAAPELGWWVQIDANGAVIFWISKTGSDQFACQSPNGTIVPGRTYMIGTTYVAGVQTLYVNGLPVATNSPGGAVHTVATANAAAVGRSGAVAGDYFIGRIDEPAKWTNLAFTDAEMLAFYKAGAGQASYDLPLPRLYWRQPKPPHGVKFVTSYDSLRWGHQLGAAQTMTFNMPRTMTRRAIDLSETSILDWVRDELTRGELPMVTAEYDDGRPPFVGFVTQIPRMDDGDPYATVTVKDHWARLAAAPLPTSGSVSGASGLLIANAARYAIQQSKPALHIDLSLLSPIGPGGSYEYRANTLEQFIREMEKQTGWEAFFVFDLDVRHCRTYLAWTAQRGFDRRNGLTLRQGRQLATFGYPLDFEAGTSSGVAVGGSGSFSDRTVETAAINTGKPQPFQSAFGGTRYTVNQQVTDSRVLAVRASELLTTPENAVARPTGKLLEAETDMTKIEVGSIYTVKTTDGFLGAATEHLVRLVALQMDPASGVHDVQFVEVA